MQKRMAIKRNLKNSGFSICNESIASSIYLAALAIYLFIRTWETTMFPQHSLAQKVGILICLLLITVKMVCFDELTVKRIILTVVASIIGLISYLHGGSIHFLIVIGFIAGANNVDIVKALKLYLVVVGIVFFAALIFSQVGIIEDLLYDIYDWEKVTIFGVDLPAAHSLGGIYCTDTAARCFFWLLVFYYVYSPKLGVVCSLVLALFSAIVFLVTHGRLDSICILLLALISLADYLINKLKTSRIRNVWEKTLSVAAVVSVPIAALISCFCSYYYNGENAYWQKVDLLFTNRLMFGNNAIKKYGLNLFGHQIEMNGLGGVSTTEFLWQGIEYNYIDCSFVQILLMNGLLVLLIIIAVYVAIAWKNKEDTCLMICICMIALNCMVAQHLLDISYVPFILVLNMNNPRVSKLKEKTQEYTIQIWSIISRKLIKRGIDESVS